MPKRTRCALCDTAECVAPNACSGRGRKRDTRPKNDRTQAYFNLLGDLTYAARLRGLGIPLAHLRDARWLVAYVEPGTTELGDRIRAVSQLILDTLEENGELA